MAGTFLLLRFAATATTPDELIAGIEAFAKGRAVERTVGRLEWPLVYGLTAEDWALTGQEPSELGLTPDDASDEALRRSQKERCSLSQAAARWPLDAWHGLRVDFDLPPDRDGFPEIYGALHWSLWRRAGTWRHRMTIEYPTSSVRHDPRWATWKAGIIEAAAAAFGCACVEGPDEEPDDGVEQTLDGG